MKNSICFFLCILSCCCCVKKKEPALDVVELARQLVEEVEKQNASSESGIQEIITIDTLSSHEKEEIKIYKEYQKRIETEDKQNIYDMTDKDIDIATNLLIKGLVGNGFKTVQDEEFHGRIRKFFNMDINSVSFRFLKKHGTFDVYLMDYSLWDGNSASDRDYFWESEYDYTYDHLFFIRNHNFITILPQLGDIVESINGQVQIYVRPDFVHRNKYILNDCRASFIWLLNNDKEFLVSLFKTFGYDKESRINELVLEEVYRIYENENDIHYDYDDFHDLLFSRGFNGNLRIHHGMLATIKELTTMENTRYYKMLGEFLIRVDSGTFKSDLSDEEKVELFCTFGRTELDILKEYPYAKRRPNAYISSLLLAFNNYEEIASRHDYWNIRNFEDIVKVAEWEYTIANEGDESKMFFDYTTLE